jgi:glutathione S-transferase
MLNCLQRAHANTLDQGPNFLISLLIAGLEYPYLAAGCGLVGLVGRVAYTL